MAQFYGNMKVQYKENPKTEIRVRPPNRIRKKNPMGPPFDLKIVEKTGLKVLEIENNVVTFIFPTLDIRTGSVNNPLSFMGFELEIFSTSNGVTIFSIAFKNEQYHILSHLPGTSLLFLGDDKKMTIEAEVFDSGLFWEFLGLN